MHMKNVLTALVAFSAVADAAILRPRKSPFSRALRKRQFGDDQFNNGDQFNQDDQNQDDQNQDDQNQDDQNQDDQNQDNGGDNGGGDATQLNPDVIQTGSQQEGAADAAEGQVASATDDANFINFCEGATLTNGEQNEGGSCNGIPMGNIPSVDRMVSCVFTSPQNGDDIAADTDFTIEVQMLNFAPGSFTDADTTYYSAPQDLDGGGNIIGHTHVTVQDTGGDTNPTQPLDPTQFAFFKGINDAGNGQGLLAADVEGGLPAGNYRLCSMVSAANHQPVIMPVAQRGAQDDCIRFTVSDGGGGGNGDDAAQDDQNQDDQNQDDQNQDDAAQDDQNQDDAAQDDQNQDDQNQDGQFDFGGGGNQDGQFGGGNQDGQFGGGNQDGQFGEDPFANDGQDDQAADDGTEEAELGGDNQFGNGNFGGFKRGA